MSEALPSLVRMPDPTPAPAFPGPSQLGRGVVVGAGAAVPGPFGDVERVVVTDALLADPAPTVDRMYRCWLDRQPVVVELACDVAELRRDQTVTVPLHQLAGTRLLLREQLRFVVWANNYDLRSGTPVWWHAVLASRHRGAKIAPPEAGGEVVLADGTPAWVDGGPRGPAHALDGIRVVHRESVQLADDAPRPRNTAPIEDPRVADHLAGLAPDQVAAVRHPAGPARVVAPAGSGKTRVLAARMHQLRRVHGVEPGLITALAYNTRAADELRLRVGASAGTVRTLHAMALAICRAHAPVRVIDEIEVRRMLARLVTPARTPNNDPFQPWLDALAQVRIGLRDPDEVEAELELDGLADVVVRYRNQLADGGLVDFDEQIHRAVELLLADPRLRDRVRPSATHLLVDEAQDLTPAYLLLVQLLAGPARQVFVVGDDDQTIYGYAGADPRFLTDMHRWCPDATNHALEVNYRCPPDVVTAAANLLAHNRIRVAKRIRPGSPAPDGLTIHRHEPAHLADAALQLASGDGGASRAFLTRVTSALLAVQVVLAQAGIGHSAPLGVKVLDRTGIRAAYAYLRMGLAPEAIRAADVLDTINRPVRKLRTAVAPVLGARTSLKGLRRLARELDPSHRTRYREYLDELRQLADAIRSGADTSRCLAIIRREIGLGGAMETLDASRTRPEGSTHGDDLDALEQLALRHDDPSTFAEWIRAMLQVPATPDGLTLTTVHRVKGMEWDHVIVYGANAGLFPHRMAADIEEERRVFHVALTRGAQWVDVLADRTRPSPFLDELERAPAPSLPAPSPPAPSRPMPARTARTGQRVPATQAGPASQVHAVTFEALRAWRSETARQLGTPAFLVLHDRHLDDIAARMPRDTDELAACAGIGPVKLDRFGTELLAVVDRHR